MPTKRRHSPILWIIILLALVPLGILLTQLFILDSQNSSLDRLTPILKEKQNKPLEKKIISRIDGAWEKETQSNNKEITPTEEKEPVSHLYQGIQARVLDAYTKKPISRFTLYFCEASEGIIENNMLANKARVFRKRDGILRLFGLDEGEYSIAIKAQGYAPFIRRELKVPQKENLLVFEVSRGTFIEGKVVDTQGNPIQATHVYLDVELENPADSPPARRIARTDAIGKFLFGDLPPGRYSLFLKSLQDPLVEVTDIYLPRGGTHYQELIMPDMNTLEFMITDVYNRPLPNATIKVFEKSGKSSFPPLKTDQYGKANLPYVPPGDYHLRIFKSTFKPEIDEDFKILAGSEIIRVQRSLDKEE